MCIPPKILIPHANSRKLLRVPRFRLETFLIDETVSNVPDFFHAEGLLSSSGRPLRTSTSFFFSRIFFFFQPSDFVRRKKCLKAVLCFCDVVFLTSEGGGGKTVTAPFLRLRRSSPR